MSELPSSIIVAIEGVIAERKAKPPTERSYVRSLLDGGIPKISAKVIEEAGEVVEASNEPDEAGRSHLTREAADLVFHLLVLLGHRGVAWESVEAELAGRFGISGIVEKESRGRAGST